MQLKCVRPFGNFKPGDSVEVPDGAVFDTFYFETEPESAPPASEAAPEPAEGASK